MADYTYYDIDTGEITGYYSGSKDPSLNGTHYVSGSFNRKFFRVVNGEPVEKPEEELEAIQVEEFWVRLRQRRDGLLQKSDWTQMPDAPLDATKKEEWKVYRQQLRDLPANTLDPRQVEWPTPPE